MNWISVGLDLPAPLPYKVHGTNNFYFRSRLANALQMGLPESGRMLAWSAFTLFLLC